ncbi:glycoside hydrolase family 32 protein [Treponema sp. HNW]|uniref:GH32 C-terminal domain-containing protein n=1 Tax=Treponema sp. HNW TaxID=3116654 RepID=UPI003D0AB56A
MQNISFESDDYKGLAVFGTRISNSEQCSLILQDDKNTSLLKTITSETFMFHFEINTNVHYRLTFENANANLVYLDTGAKMLNRGIKFLTEVKYNQLYRNRYHFSPPVGWMNDPNGLVFYKDKVHLFYQFNPFSQIWGNMHWGHAVSTDLIHWTHLPVVFYPQPELQDRKNLRGGAFSGSAIVKNDLLHVFFTRHYGAFDRSWAKEWQVKATSSDGIIFENEHTVLTADVEGIEHDFRDPKIFAYENHYLMVIGGKRYGHPVVFLYRSDNTEHWDFVSVLYEETDIKYAVAECPDFFLLDGKWVLIVGFINENARIKEPRDVKYLTGEFNGTTFKTEHSGLLDYGKDFYAPQTFLYKNRRICFGWNSDPRGIYRPQPASANGTLSLPRELHIEHGSLIQQPVKEIFYTVKESPTYTLPFFFNFKINKSKDFTITILSTQEGKVVLKYAKQLFSIEVAKASCNNTFISDLKQLEVFVDISLMEIFINNGSMVLTHRYYLEGYPKILLQIESETKDYYIKSSNINDIWEKYSDKK